jgi:hypothetical protein
VAQRRRIVAGTGSATFSIRPRISLLAKNAASREVGARVAQNTDARPAGCPTQINLTLAVQAAPPQRRHLGDHRGGIADLPMQGVFGAAVNDALGAQSLTGAQLLAFDQQRAISTLAQPGQQP